MNIINGNVLDADCDVILHQVNCMGVMGSGVAKQVKNRYPKAYSVYKDMCDSRRGDPEGLLGYAQAVLVEDVPKKYVCNLFAQLRYGRDRMHTDYDSLEKCFRSANTMFKGQRVAIPYRIGCDRGGGDWSVVSSMIERCLVDCDVTLYKFNG